MFTSKLTHIIEQYDPYGIHRINGVKATYLLFVLFFVNLVFNIHNPYFYFFYAPMTAINVEVLGLRLKDKYRFLIFTLIFTTFMVFLFDTSRHYPFVLFFVAFISILMLYRFVLTHNKDLLVTIPIIFSLAAYSLQYGQYNADLATAFYNILKILSALCILVAALIFFPLNHYYRAWLRAFYLLTEETLGVFKSLAENKSPSQCTIHGHTLNLFNLSYLLPRKAPIFSILKINLLINKLHLIGCTLNPENYHQTEWSQTIIQLEKLLCAIQNETICSLESPIPITLTKLIQSWNFLSSKQ